MNCLGTAVAAKEVSVQILKKGKTWFGGNKTNSVQRTIYKALPYRRDPMQYFVYI